MLRPLSFLLRSALLMTGILLMASLIHATLRRKPTKIPVPIVSEPLLETGVDKVNRAFERHWLSEGVAATPGADPLTLIRRLSLALTGAPPSIEEIDELSRWDGAESPPDLWLAYLFEDPRYHHYLAERLARVFVGTEAGPFLVYRRHRFVKWLADEISLNRPYDELASQMISASGIWTTHPEANYLTVAVTPDEGEKGPDEIKLAARTSRAFLGLSLDCMQCHDDKLGDHWTQRDFHALASFFAPAEVSLTGVRDIGSASYTVETQSTDSPVEVEPAVPFLQPLLPQNGSTRERLAGWITHPENRAFSRIVVNRTWALLFGRPLHDPIDNLPVEGPFPIGMEALVDVFVESGFDLRHLIRVIASSEPFLRDSRSSDPSKPVTADQENHWAAFPLTPLRPEQVAGAIAQASSLETLDHQSHLIQQLRQFGETNNFVTRFGDPGEQEFEEATTTIPQRLLLMNGEMVNDRIEANLIMNASSRIARYAPDSKAAVETAFLATLTRRPSTNELEHFETWLNSGEHRHNERALEDLYWTLINSAEFSWNR